MKALSISGFVLGILSFIGGLYLQFILAPAADSLEASLDTGFSDEMTSMMFMAAHEAKVSTGEILIIVGGLAFILCIIPAIKTKNKLAYTGAVLSLLAVLAGLVNSTHMFS
jgi:hypothetical protein